MLRKWLRSPLVTAALFAVATGLILFGGIRGVQAAPRIQSTWFGAEVELDDIDVRLTEECVNDDGPEFVHGDGTALDESGKALRGLLEEEHLLPEGEEFTIGKTYQEKLAVCNTENAYNNNKDTDDGVRIIKEYVRVTVYKYWTTENETVDASELDPSKIELHFVTDGKWSIDANSSDTVGKEEDIRRQGVSRTVLYYSDIVEPQSTTENFTDTIRIDSSVLDDPNYKGAKFHIEAVVDAVQTHNGEDAMMSAWGNNDMIAVGNDAEE